MIKSPEYTLSGSGGWPGVDVGTLLSLERGKTGELQSYQKMLSAGPASAISFLSLHAFPLHQLSTTVVETGELGRLALL